MSIHLVRAVLDNRDPRLTSADRFVLLIYAEYASEQHEKRAWPSVGTVASESGLGASTVARSMTKLQRIGYLQKTGKRRVGEHAWVWIYEVQVPEELPQREIVDERGTPTDAVEELPQRETNRKGEPEVVPPTETPSGVSAQNLVSEWLDHCEQRPGSRVIGQVARELKILINDKIPGDVIRAGLIEWHRKRLHPSALASVVHTTSLGPAERPSTADQRLASGAALVARLEARERLAIAE